MIVLAVLIVAGSRNLAYFDAALVGYTFATLFAAFAITYRYAMWLQRPPTALYWRRGWQMFLQPRRSWQQSGAICQTTRGCLRPEPLHLAAQLPARAGPLADHVGLPHRCGHHLPSRLWLDSLRDGARRHRALPHLRLRLSDVWLPGSFRDRLLHFPRAGVGVVAGHRWRDAGDVAAGARSWRQRRCNRSARTFCRSSCCWPSASPA